VKVTSLNINASSIDSDPISPIKKRMIVRKIDSSDSYVPTIV
jgi:hypothetical protein